MGRTRTVKPSGMMYHQVLQLRVICVSHVYYSMSKWYIILPATCGWGLIGLVKDGDVMSVARLPDLEGEEDDLEDGWDNILLTWPMYLQCISMPYPSSTCIPTAYPPLPISTRHKTRTRWYPWVYGYGCGSDLGHPRVYPCQCLVRECYERCKWAECRYGW